MWVSLVIVLWNVKVLKYWTVNSNTHCVQSIVNVNNSTSDGRSQRRCQECSSVPHLLCFSSIHGISKIKTTEKESEALNFGVSHCKDWKYLRLVPFAEVHWLTSSQSSYQWIQLLLQHGFLVGLRIKHEVVEMMAKEEKCIYITWFKWSVDVKQLLNP